MAVGRHCTALRTVGMSPSLMPVEVIRGWSLLLWSLSKIAQQTPYYEWLDAWRQPVGNGRYFDLQRSASTLVQNIQFSHWHQLCFQTHPLAVRLARVEHPLVWYRRNSVQADSKKIEIPHICSTASISMSTHSPFAAIRALHCGVKSGNFSW